MTLKARLVFTTGSLQGRELEVRPSACRIGRQEESDFVIPSPDDTYVSRDHASIRLDGDRVVLTDQGSTNGTLVNGKRIERAVLESGDLVQFGKHGPIARLVLGDPSPPLIPQSSRQEGEGATQYVRRLVSNAVEKHEARSRRMTVVVGVTALFALGAATTAIAVAYSSGSEDRAFRRIVEEHEESVFLIEVGLRWGDSYIPLGHGTGFAVDDHHIITNKHVVFPELFGRDAACRVAAYRRQRGREDSRVITVWHGGSRFRQSVSDRTGDLALGHSTEHGTLELVGTASDHFSATVDIECQDPSSQGHFTSSWSRHAQDNNDLALLRTDATLKPIPLAEREPETDAPILVFGFPRAVAPMETTEADPVRMRGTVIRKQETIQIDAVVMSGNSGGPLINVDGEVVGITTRGLDNSLLNMAIKVKWARDLLERAR